MGVKDFLIWFFDWKTWLKVAVLFTYMLAMIVLIDYVGEGPYGIYRLLAYSSILLFFILMEKAEK